MSTPRGKVKVLHLITLSFVGGAQDNTFCTCERHDRERYEVHLGCNPSGQLVERARRACDVFHPIPALVRPFHPLKDLRAFLDILRLLRRLKFDLVHTHTAKAGFLGRLAASLCRTPVIVHTYHQFPFHDFMPVGGKWFYILLERAVRPFTSFFVTVSDRDFKEGARLRILDRVRTRTVYSGIDFVKLDRPSDPAEKRRSLNIPERWQVVVIVGRLEPQKAPQLLVEAFSHVVRLHPNSMLMLVGDGELRAELEARIRTLDLEQHIRILGFRDDVPDLLSMADVFASSSLWEGMGRSMTEAMLLGRAVVVPAICGIPEIVRDRDTGLLYDVGNVGQLAERLGFLLDHPEERRRLGENARHLTRELFDVNDMVTNIERIYEQLLTQL